MFGLFIKSINTHFLIINLKKLVLILKISLLSALGTGIQLLFLGSLIPIILIFFIHYFFKKKNLKILLTDFIVFLFLFYFSYSILG